MGGVKWFLANRPAANRTIIPESHSNPDLNQPSEIEAHHAGKIQRSDIPVIIHPEVKRTLDEPFEEAEGVDNIPSFSKVFNDEFPSIPDLNQPSEIEVHHAGKKQQSDIPVFIPPKVKRTLDDLFEGAGGVDNIPSFSKVFKGEIPSIEDMDAPIMKGWCRNSKKLLEYKPFIAIKMRCTSSKELIDETLGLKPKQQSYTDYSRERVLILHQYRQDLPLMWDQFRGDVPTVYPSFFDWNFTFPEDGTGPTNSQAKTYPLLKQCIADGHGKDAKGIEWEIIGR